MKPRICNFFKSTLPANDSGIDIDNEFRIFDTGDEEECKLDNENQNKTEEKYRKRHRSCFFKSHSQD